MTVGARSAPVDARSSAIASGCPRQSTTSPSPPAARTKSRTHSAARTTSPACELSAEIDGMRRNSASSANQASAAAIGRPRLPPRPHADAAGSLPQLESHPMEGLDGHELEGRRRPPAGVAAPVPPPARRRRRAPRDRGVPLEGEPAELAAGRDDVDDERPPGADDQGGGRRVARAVDGVGVVEIVAGILVALKPRYAAYIVAAWLLGIVINLWSYGNWWDVSVRDFGLMLGPPTLGRLASVYDPP